MPVLMFVEHSIVIGHQMQLLTSPWEMGEQMGHGVFSSFTLAISSHCHPFSAENTCFCLPCSLLNSAQLKVAVCVRRKRTHDSSYQAAPVLQGPKPKAICLAVRLVQTPSPTLKGKKTESILLQPGELGSLSHTGCYKYSLKRKSQGGEIV